MIESEGAMLYCRTMGEGAPLIVINGGVGLPHDYLLPGLEKLKEQFFIIFYDQRATGRSEGAINSEVLALEKQLADIEAIRRFFGFEKISIFGHSWGGMLSMHYAIEYGEYLHRLILCDSIPATSEMLELFYAST